MEFKFNIILSLERQFVCFMKVCNPELPTDICCVGIVVGAEGGGGWLQTYNQYAGPIIPLEWDGGIKMYKCCRQFCLI